MPLNASTSCHSVNDVVLPCGYGGGENGMCDLEIGVEVVVIGVVTVIITTITCVLLPRQYHRRLQVATQHDEFAPRYERRQPRENRNLEYGKEIVNCQ
jgi:hypothetical protein